MDDGTLHAPGTRKRKHPTSVPVTATPMDLIETRRKLLMRGESVRAVRARSSLGSGRFKNDPNNRKAAVPRRYRAPLGRRNGTRHSALTKVIEKVPLGRGAFGVVSQHATIPGLVVKHADLRASEGTTFGRVNDGMLREINAVTQIPGTQATSFLLLETTSLNAVVVEPRMDTQIIQRPVTGGIPGRSRRGMSPRHWFQWALQLREQLRTVHGSGFFHGDVTITNTMLCNSTQSAHLIDLSAAGILHTSIRLRDDDSCSKRKQGLPLRTMEWSRAPEPLFDAAEPHGTASDAWGLGCVLLHALCGRCLDTYWNTFEFRTAHAVEYLRFFGTPKLDGSGTDDGSGTVAPELLSLPLFRQTLMDVVAARTSVNLPQKEPFEIPSSTAFRNFATECDVSSPLRFVRTRGHATDAMLRFNLDESGWQRKDVLLALDILRGLFDFDQTRRSMHVECIAPWHTKEVVSPTNVWDAVKTHLSDSARDSQTLLSPVNDVMSTVPAPLSLALDDRVRSTLPSSEQLMPLPRAVNLKLPLAAVTMGTLSGAQFHPPFDDSMFRGIMVSAMADVCFGREHGGHERLLGLDLLVVAVQTLWLLATSESDGPLWSRSLRGLQNCAPGLECVGSCAIINAETVLNCMEARDESSTLSPTLEVMRSCLATRLQRQYPTATELTNVTGRGVPYSTEARKVRVNVTASEMIRELNGATVRPLDLPHLVHTARNTCGIKERTFSREHIFLPSFIEMVRDEFWWTKLFARDDLGAVTREFNRRCLAKRASLV